MSTEQFLQQAIATTVAALYGQQAAESPLQIQTTRKEFKGDYTLVAFPLLRASRKGPEQTCTEIGEHLTANCPQVAEFNVVKGFLNITLAPSYWANVLIEMATTPNYGFVEPQPNDAPTVIEFSSPNTNKPLHLGHIRNNLLGESISRITEKSGKRVIRVNLVNDRGIHICKSMVAWQRYGNGETPQSTSKKGDHLVGDYYVKFDQHYKTEIQELISQGKTEEEAKAQAPIMLEAQETLRRWEAKDAATIDLWRTMNGWVLDGFDATYRAMDIKFDKTYFESNTYLLGKSVVQQGLADGVFYRRDDGSVWIDLTSEGLDEKLLLRADGTSVYMTQDIGTAIERQRELQFAHHIYVVGNEQEYHFQVLKLVMKRLGYAWSDQLYHLSYGMVNLPEGKMKSREGTVVDADDLIEEMVSTAAQMAQELGKANTQDPETTAHISRMVGMGALKYFILKVNPKSGMTFNPKESIDFNGNTGPFIQYTHARICSVLERAHAQGLHTNSQLPEHCPIADKELELIQLLHRFPETVQQAAQNHNPALVANYAYDLAKEYNQFYHDHSILKETNTSIQQLRLVLSEQVGLVIRRALWLLGIEAPEKM